MAIAAQDCPNTDRSILANSAVVPSVPRRPLSPALPAFHDHRRIGVVFLGQQPNAVDLLAVFQDELAALVFVDGPGNAVREKSVADGPRAHGILALSSPLLLAPVIQAEAIRCSRINLAPFVAVRGFAYSLSDFLFGPSQFGKEKRLGK
jgi:hypothetical protein